MKNVTIALDDETHRLARIRAAELGTSLSALVKDYLGRLAADRVPATSSEVREMAAPYAHAQPAPLPPRKLGQMKGEIWMADDFDTWPQDIQASFDAALEGAITRQS